MTGPVQFLASLAVTIVAMSILVPTLFFIARTFGLYAIVEERRCRVYVLFGKVLAVLDQPGLHILPLRLGPAAFIMNWLGRCYVLDMRMDQEYLRSTPVNSEEGAPMGIGIWYEMYIGDPVSYLFKNADPRGSLAANVGSAAIRSLSNMKLAAMLENRHAMSQTVRAEVSPKSQEWGYRLGSVYVRKVHFRDVGMIKGIEAKVVNRLRQVTSAIKQDGANQVSVITSSAERQAAVEFAKAAAMRPRIVGEALQKIGQDPEIARAMFDILETQRVLDSKAEITLVPRHGGVLGDLLASAAGTPAAPAAPER